MRRDIKLRRRYPGSIAFILARSRIWPGRSPSTHPLLLPARDMIVPRTDSSVARNRGHWSVEGTILVSTRAGGCLKRKTVMTSSVRYIEWIFMSPTRQTNPGRLFM